MTSPLTDEQKTKVLAEAIRYAKLEASGLGGPIGEHWLKVTEFVEGDGPKIELLPGVTEPYADADTRTRTISMRAIGATFHHSKRCPCGGGYQ